MLNSVGLMCGRGNWKRRSGRWALLNPCVSFACVIAAALAGASAGSAQTTVQPSPAGVATQSTEGQDKTPTISVAPAVPNGTLIGQVTDSDGELVQGAQVTLSGAGPLRTTTTGTDGRFSFSALTPGAFHLVVTAKGRAADDLDGTLTAGQIFDAGTLALHAAADLTIEVFGPHAAAEVEVKKEEHQRILGFLPNFYVSYDFRAPALDARQKWELNWRTLVDPVNVALLAGQAGIEQATGAFSGFGPGPDGYGKRFGAGAADFVIGNSLSGWILPIVFKQDPRYFYMGTGTKRHRFLYALSTAVVARGDNGKWQPAYANILGDFGAGAASNLYYPAVNRRGASLTLENSLLAIGLDGVNNVVQEFLLRHVTPGTHKP